MKSLVLGTSSVDTLLHVPEIHTLEDDMSLWATSVTETIGSTGAGKAFALDVLGSEVTLLTDIGEDQYKDKILSFYETTNIHLHRLPTDKSTAHTNIMHSKGKRITVFTSSPTIHPQMHKDFQALMEETDVVFLNINNYCRDYIPMIKQYNKPVFVDIHDYQEGNPYHQDFIDAADILVASGVYIPNHVAFLHKYIDLGKQIVIITKGSDGLIAMDHSHRIYELPGYHDFDFVDSNGAGDSFTAGFMYEYFETGDILQSLKVGTICGGIACSSMELYHRDYNKDVIQKLVKKVSW